jgi:HSP20 family protein
MWGFTNTRVPDVWGELNRLQREMDRAFGWAGGGRAACSVFPPINLYDDGESFVVRAELPGVVAKDLDVQATAGSLRIKGERGAEKASVGQSAHRRERDHGVFDRTIELEAPIDAERIVAKLENGVLTVIAPKVAEAKPRRIAIG